MDQQDKIAHLNELAQEHFNEGNLSAAVNAWQQVLELDASNADAQRGVQLAKSKMGADDNPLGGGDESPFDQDATMMMTPGGAGPGGGGGGPFDADATMMFQPGGSGGGGDDDGDATMMFNPGSMPAPGVEAGGGSAPEVHDSDESDADATMMFTPGSMPDLGAGGAAASDEGEATMMFNPGAMPPPGGGAGDDDEGAATMMFQPGAAPPDLGGGAEDDDADATMMFNPGSMPSPGAPEPSGGGGLDFGLPSESSPSEDADQTMMSPEGSSFDLGGGAPSAPPPAPPEPEPPAPSPPPAPEPPAADDQGGLEDFELPSGGLEMAGPPGGGGVSLPDMPAPSGGDSGGGFSFDLPPAGAPPTEPASGGSAPSGDFNLPELPSLGPPPPPAGGPPEPPSLAPPPPPPPSMGGDSGQPSGQFGEVDPGEIEGLAVPTVGGGEAEEEAEEQLTDEERRLREEQKAAEYAAMYGKSEGAPGGAPMAGGESFSAGPAPSAIPWKMLIPLLGVVVIVVGAVGAWFIINQADTPDVVIDTTPKPPPEPERTPAEWAALFAEEKAQIEEALNDGNLDEAVTHAAKAREIAPKANMESTPELDQLLETLEFEQAWEAKFRQAVDFFCVEQYEDAIVIFDELKPTKLDDHRPDEYIGRIYYNLAIIELQALRPWDAVWPFEQALKRVPDDAEALELKSFAEQFPRGMQLIGNYDYTSVVDPLVFRKAGCS